ncbi:hypothetical protein [Fibrella aquatilis]|uniref:Uncharacterized protein n=1 Tax=Fibrella aquatilis TaxID=2817059 RepID=A0A939G4C7_9BACT|nr:hypothetical protein [Fibrella aquatilis]MBO0929751.1 hypothetical protein [Fibrella aquatilis]
MIVLFIKSDLIRHQSLPGHTCPNCRKTGEMDLELRQRYAEFATMTMNPRGVFGLAHCLHCGYILPASRWDEDLHRSYKALKAGYKTPLRYWQGAIRTAIGFVAGLVLLVGVLFFMGQSQRADFARRDAVFSEVLARPKPGTTLVVVGNNTGMAVWRISRVGNGTVWLNNYVGNRVLANVYTETGWATLPDSDFSAEAVGYSAQIFAKRGLKQTADMANKTKPYDGTVFAVLDN